MRVFACCVSLVLSVLGFSQDKLYSCGNNGEIIEFNHLTCSSRSLGFYDVFGDIAVTSDGNLYGINDRLYQIDTLIQSTIPISPQLITNIGGLGLMALDDDRLIYDKSDSLFLFDLSTSMETFIGVVGYQSNGDFALFNGSIYMISSENELIRITLNPSGNSIALVTNVGVLDTHSSSAYSIFSTYKNCATETRGLFVIDETTVYTVNEFSAQVEKICVLQNQQFSFGSAALFNEDNGSFIGGFPNVFTPNGDGLNDEYLIDNTDHILKFQILNRWGNVIYSWNSGSLKWDGKDPNSSEVSEGVYFYIVEFANCGELVKASGHISLLR